MNSETFNVLESMSLKGIMGPQTLSSLLLPGHKVSTFVRHTFRLGYAATGPNPQDWTEVPKP